VLAVGTSVRERVGRLYRHQRRIQHLQLGARCALPRRVADKLAQARQQAGAGKQVQVVRQRRGVAGVVKLAQHLRIREHLARVPAAELEQAAQQRRLVDPSEVKPNASRISANDQ
jgi:hypothetical protein